MPIVGRHLSFVSPYAAFVVLGAIVAAIMLQVSTYNSFVASPPQPLANAGDLATRYLLAPAIEGPAGRALVLTAFQKAALGLGAVAALIAVAARVMTNEARSARLGPFLYLLIGTLVVMLFLVVGIESHARALLEGMP